MEMLDVPEFDSLNEQQQSELIENERHIQREKRMSISSIDDELFDNILIPMHYNIKECLLEVNQHRDLVIGIIMKNETYLNSLQKTFEDLEDIEDLDGIDTIYSIIKLLVWSCDASLLEILLEEKYIELLFGIFEYDPSNVSKISHRFFLKEKSAFQLDIMFNKDDKIIQIINKNYRLQYMRDCVIAYMIDETLANTLNSMVYANHQDIISYILDYEHFFSKLLDTYDMSVCVAFFLEFLTVVKGNFIQELKNRTIALFNYHSVFNELVEYFIESISDTKQIFLLLNIFQIIQQIDVNVLVKQIIDKQQSEFMESINSIILSNDSGIIQSILELFKAMTEQQVAKKFQMVDAIFYKVIQPLLNSLDQKHLEKQIEIIDFITQFFIHNLTRHGISNKIGFKLRGFLMQQSILQTLQKYLSKNNKNINLSLVRLFKNIILQNDEIMIKYLQTNECIVPIIKVFLALKNKSNILSSCFIELFQFILRNNIQKMISAIMHTFYYTINKESYWELLKIKYKNQNDFNPKQPEDQNTEQIKELHNNSEIILIESKDQSYQRQLDQEAEENYFAEQDDIIETIEDGKQINSDKIKDLQRKISFKQEDEDISIHINQKSIATPQNLQKKASFSFSLNFDTFKKVKMDD